MLIAVGFWFAVMGAANSTQITLLEKFDQFLLANDPRISENVDILRSYIVEIPPVRHIPFINSEFTLAAIDCFSKNATWLLKLIAASCAYYQRNRGAVIASLAVGAVTAMILKFFFQNVVVIGRYRYAMENRGGKEVSFRRVLAPFHAHNLPNVIKVMVMYNLVTDLWSLTIIGGFYKYYQYSAVPYLLAENPSITWKEAKRLSAEMTNGYKWKMFCTRISFLHIWLLKLLPLIGLLTAVPLEMSLDAEMYMAIRNNPDREKNPLLTEPVFSEPAYVDQPKETREAAQEPQYALKDLTVSLPIKTEKLRKYQWTDFVFMFFVFAIAGWLWECGLYIVRDHLLVNRGSLHGPWVPIYGVGGTAMVLLLDRFRENKGKVFAMELIFCGVLEYLSSFLLEYFFNLSYWNYKTDYFNLNGRIYLAGLIAFGIGGMLAIYLVAPAIANTSDKVPKKLRISLSFILCAGFLTDLVICFLYGFNAGAGVGGTI